MTRPAQFACLVALTITLSCTENARAKAGVIDRADLRQSASSPASKQEIVFQSGELTLHGVIYTPHGPGPFPAVLWNHGSWGDPMVAFDHVAATFTDAGWLFFGPFRRGQGLSSSAGPYILDEIDRAGRSGGMNAKAAKAVSLLTREHLDDQLAAYGWLKNQPYVLANRIAVAGNSFGGVEAVLGVERVPYCAAINGAGGSSSWALAPELREVMMCAAKGARAPMLLFQAENDFDLSPSRTLAAVMSSAGKAAEVKIYPAYGSTRGEGHNFAWLGSDVWGHDVLAFLRQHCGG
jgi:dipeptidyl aminopeptidase/acylaminoacyl peptidase